MNKNQLPQLSKVNWRTHKKHCKNKIDKLGNAVHFLLSYEDWCNIWLNSGVAHLRGRGKGTYCMSRINDIGHYEVGNVFIQTNDANTSQALSDPVIREQWRHSLSEAAKKQWQEGRGWDNKL